MGHDNQLEYGHEETEKSGNDVPQVVTVVKSKIIKHKMRNKSSQ